MTRVPDNSGKKMAHMKQDTLHRSAPASAGEKQLMPEFRICGDHVAPFACIFERKLNEPDDFAELKITKMTKNFVQSVGYRFVSQLRQASACAAAAVIRTAQDSSGATIVEYSVLLGLLSATGISAISVTGALTASGWGALDENLHAISGPAIAGVPQAGSGTSADSAASQAENGSGGGVGLSDSAKSSAASAAAAKHSAAKAVKKSGADAKRSAAKAAKKSAAAAKRQG